MSGFKSQFSQFPRFIQQEGAVYTPSQIPTQNIPQQMPPQPPPPQMPEPFVPPVRKNLLKAIFISLLVVIVLLGAGFTAVLGLRIWDPMWNPFRPKPEAVFSQSLLKMKDIKKYGYKMAGNISLNATDSNSENANVLASLNSNGKIDITDILNPKFDSVLDFIVNLSTSDPQESVGISSAGEARVVDKNLYFKISKLEATGTSNEDLKEYISSFIDVKDEWVKIAKEQLLGDNSSETQKKEIENKVKAIFEKYPVWQIAGELADEKIGTENVYHYVIALNKDNLKKAFAEIIKIGAELNSEENSSVDYFLGVAEGFANTFFNKLGEVKADIWIGKKDVLVYKIDFKKSVDLKQLIGTIDGNFDISLNLELSDHNKPVEVQIPFEAKSFEEVFGPFIKRAENKEKSNKITLGINQIASSAASLLDSKKSYSGLSCKTNDVICNDIKAQTGEEPKVFGYYKKFCAYSKLIKLDDSYKQEYYCVDYNLSSIKTDIDPSLKGYCTGYTFECPKPFVSPSPSVSPLPE